MKTAIRRAVLAMTFLSLATIAAADTLDSPAHRTVKFGDLNLGSTSGVSLLYGRIRRAAREVCESDSVWNLDALLATKACTARAIEQAVEDVNEPLLKSYHRAQTRADTLAQR